MRKLSRIIIIFILLLILVACDNNASIIDTEDEIPKIAIKSDDIKIDYVVGLNYWNKNVYDRSDNFLVIMEKGFEVLPYFELGSEITISFDDDLAPDEYELYDYILNENGTPKYTDNEVIKRPISLDKGTGSFSLETHFAALLSSHSNDYKNGTSIRGFKLVCRWGEDECEYGFIIRSDAH
ncbi:MAG: hypothetical protein JEZ08_20630 [Clostridiales bacterium]|nr:hypothetical protein [Clostridiales bacterium]